MKDNIYTADLLGAVFNSMPAMVFVIDENAEILFGNRSGLSVTHYWFETIEGKRGGDAFDCYHHHNSS